MASEALFALKPVTFRYKKEIDPQGISQFGLVAEDVEAANPDLVIRDKEGKPFTVRYEAVNAMLLNEFLKEHQTVQELKASVAQQKKQINALTARPAESERTARTEQTRTPNCFERSVKLSSTYHSLKSPLCSCVSITLPAAL